MQPNVSYISSWFPAEYCQYVHEMTVLTHCFCWELITGKEVWGVQTLHHIYSHRTRSTYNSEKNGCHLRYNEMQWGKVKPDTNQLHHFS